VRKLRAASVAEITAVPGIGPKLAATIAAALGSNSLPEGTPSHGAKELHEDG
jgi:DNA repair protein RadC